MITKTLIRKHTTQVMKMVHEENCIHYKAWLKKGDKNNLGHCPNTCSCGGRKTNNHFTAAYWIVIQELSNIMNLGNWPRRKRDLKIFTQEMKAVINTAFFMMIQHHPSQKSKQEDEITNILSDLWGKV